MNFTRAKMKAFIYRHTNEYFAKFEADSWDSVLEKLQAMSQAGEKLPPGGYVQLGTGNDRKPLSEFVEFEAPPSGTSKMMEGDSARGNTASPSKNRLQWGRTSKRGKLGILLLALCVLSLVITILDPGTYDEDIRRQRFEDEQDRAMSQMSADILHGRSSPSSGYDPGVILEKFDPNQPTQTVISALVLMGLAVALISSGNKTWAARNAG